MLSTTATTTSARNRSLFTPTQWQELEHQALIFKYMVSGVPIPPELIYSTKRSLELSLASRLSHQPIEWGCFQMGFSRKTDPEPGRCKRTDGKKWRCSKDAYPNSKYCERHMHRGRNRSRKHVEVTSTTTTTIPSLSVSTMNRNISLSTNNSTPLSSSTSTAPDNIYTHQNNPNNTNTYLNPFFYHYSSSSRPPDSGLSLQTAHHNFLDSGSSSNQTDKDFRYFHGLREGIDERAFFPEASGRMSSYKGYSSHESEYHQSFADYTKKQQQQQQQQEQQCFVLGTDINSTRAIKLGKGEYESKKPLHHFFGEWTPKNTDQSCLDLTSNNSSIHTNS